MFYCGSLMNNKGALYDLYTNWLDCFNIIPAGNKNPLSGYKNIEYIAKVKGFSGDVELIKTMLTNKDE